MADFSISSRAHLRIVNQLLRLMSAGWTAVPMTASTASAAITLAPGQQHRDKEPGEPTVASCEVCVRAEPRLATSWLAKSEQPPAI
ncbi:hypothetical protein EKO04_007944 [Ascochyta lentis]|uniref:Uncharacterized protein n=1 Tax=Ascochyta lentis TaxID=205686 RepID=A0A8H7IZZ7_9PLEO|nr:hypothetical protein EKO04_007944 [Ascochyta lentis]